MTSFPAHVVSFSDKVDETDVVFAAHINALQNEVAAIETALGTLPAGVASTVKDRIAAAEASIAAIAGRFDGSGNIPLSGVAGLISALGAKALASDLATQIANVTALLSVHQDVSVTFNTGQQIKMVNVNYDASFSRTPRVWTQIVSASGDAINASCLVYNETSGGCTIEPRLNAPASGTFTLVVNLLLVP